MKKYTKITSMLLVVSLLASCGTSGNSFKDVKSMSIDEVAGSRLVATTNKEVESEIYNYISDRIVVDKSRLVTVEAPDEKNITTLLASINTQLAGKGGTALSEDYANYLLLEFAKTPYEWAQSSKEIIGFDPAARLYFVDVTYVTTGAYKTVVPNSKIANGNPDNEKLKQKRYMDYTNMLMQKYNGNTDKYNAAYTTFINRWGEIQTIFNEQQGVSLYQRTRQKVSSTNGLGKLTYSGLVGDNNLATGATMTIRYVMKYSLNLGEETDLAVEALYLKNYKLDNADGLIAKYKLEDNSALEVLKPFIDQLILSYNKCVEESNHIGLYQLYSNYETIDKYYDDLRDYTYNAVGGYTYEILERRNKEVVVKVNRVNQIRAKGVETSLPTYDETLIFNLILGTDDTIKIKDVYLVESELIGEPLSVIRNVAGISEQIQYLDSAFSAENKAKVEEVLKKFNQVVTNGDYSSEAFLEVVDLGISQNTLNRMVDNIKAITPNKTTSYVINWGTKTNVYCSVTMREIFECANGNFDTEAIIDIGNRNGVWKVVNYTRTVSIKTNNTTLDNKQAFTTSIRTTGGEATQVGEISDKTGAVKTETGVEGEVPLSDVTLPAPIVEEKEVDVPKETPTKQQDTASGGENPSTETGGTTSTQDTTKVDESQASDFE